MKTVQMTMDDHLLDEVDTLAAQTKTSRSEFIREALHREIKRRHLEALEAQHQQSFLQQPQTDAETWVPKKRAWGDR